MMRFYEIGEAEQRSHNEAMQELLKSIVEKLERIQTALEEGTES